MNKLIQQTELKLRAVITNVMSKVTVSFKIIIGNPYVSLATEVANQDVNLVIMGTSSLDDSENLFLSSNAEKVVRNAQCPVITIKNKIHIEKIKNIVFASNFEEVNPRLVERVSFVQDLMQAKLRTAVFTANTVRYPALIARAVICKLLALLADPEKVKS